MKSKFSFSGIRFKLLLAHLLFIVFFIVIVLFFIYVQLDLRLNKIAIDYVETKLTSVFNEIDPVNKSAQDISSLISSKVFVNSGPHQIFYILKNNKNELLYHSLGSDSEDINQLVFDENNKVYSGKQWLFLYFEKKIKIDSQLLTVQFMVNPEAHREVLSIFKETILLLFPLLFIVGLLGAKYLADILFIPIRRLNKEAEEMKLDQGRPFFPIQNKGDEFEKLANTLNRSFDKISKSYGKIISFTADASHHLKLPLTVIKCETEFALEKNRSPEEYRNVLVNVLEEVDKLIIMVRKLLTLSFLDKNSDLVSKENVNLVEVIEELINYYSLLAKTRGIDLCFINELDIVLVYGDKSKLEELISNILDNAIKYNNSNGRVWIYLNKQDGEILIKIKDTGIGIGKEFQKKIFDRFFRVNQADSVEGDGLGLSISELIVRQHKGLLSVDSELGQGTTVKVFLPEVK